MSDVLWTQNGPFAKWMPVPPIRRGEIGGGAEVIDVGDGYVHVWNSDSNCYGSIPLNIYLNWREAGFRGSMP